MQASPLLSSSDFKFELRIIVFLVLRDSVRAQSGFQESRRSECGDNYSIFSLRGLSLTFCVTAGKQHCPVPRSKHTVCFNNSCELVLCFLCGHYYSHAKQTTS